MVRTEITLPVNVFEGLSNYVAEVEHLQVTGRTKEEALRKLKAEILQMCKEVDD